MSYTTNESMCVQQSVVWKGNCLDLIPKLLDSSIDVVVTSPPYWGQRRSLGNGMEEDPRVYVDFLKQVFIAILPKLKSDGIVWLNMGDSYNTPINWGNSEDNHQYSTLGDKKNGLRPSNSAYTKPRFRRKQFIDKNTGWLQYGNLLLLPQRLLGNLTEEGYLYRGEVIWAKPNAMPEGRCRRPHRKHEAIFLLAKDERHSFRVAPSVSSVWEFGNDNLDGLAHYSRFPVELPKRCIEAYGKSGRDVVVLDPFSGSGSTGLAATRLGCTYIGFEIDSAQVAESRCRLANAARQSHLSSTESNVNSQHQPEIERNGHLDF